MKEELDAQLVKDHPTLFANRFASMRETCMCWGFECGDGWYDLLKEASDKLEPILAKCKAEDPAGWNYGYYRASQVKEKFGTLRFYLSGAPPECDSIVDEAERKSAITCEECGKPGKVVGGGWLYCRCRECFQKLLDEGYTLGDYDELRLDSDNADSSGGCDGGVVDVAMPPGETEDENQAGC